MAWSMKQRTNRKYHPQKNANTKRRGNGRESRFKWGLSPNASKEVALEIETPPWMVPLLRPARYKGAYGGRGSGKSHGFATMVLAKIVTDPNCSIICIREVQKSLKQSVKKLLEQKIQKLGLGDFFEVTAKEIRAKRGEGIIIFEGMADHTAESIKSFEGFDIAWVEEAQSLSQRSLDLLRPTIRKPESELWFSWNPKHKTDPVDALLRAEEPPPGAVVVRVNFKDNPWFVGSEMVSEMEYDRRTNRDKYVHTWEGGYIQHSESKVFKRWHVEEFKAPRGAVFRYGCDWGFHPDPLTLIRIHIDGRKLYIDYEAWAIGCDIEDTPALFATVPGSDLWQVVAGSDRPERIRHMQGQGYKVIPAIRGPKSVIEGVEWLENFELVVHPRCVHTIEELELYSRKIDPLTGAILPILEDKNNHMIEALRYACEAVRRTAQGKAVHMAPMAPPRVAHSWGRR